MKLLWETPITSSVFSQETSGKVILALYIMTWRDLSLLLFYFVYEIASGAHRKAAHDRRRLWTLNDDDTSVSFPKAALKRSTQAVRASWWPGLDEIPALWPLSRDAALTKMGAT